MSLLRSEFFKTIVKSYFVSQQSLWQGLDKAPDRLMSSVLERIWNSEAWEHLMESVRKVVENEHKVENRRCDNVHVKTE